MVETLDVEKKELQKITRRNDMLKLVAIATMLVDHIGYMYYPNEMLFRIIGRLAFPIFAYQIAIGYSKTSNLKKYFLRLLAFAVITQIPYSYFGPELKFNPNHFNVLFTFVVAIGMLYFYDMGISKIKRFIKEKNYLNLVYGIFSLALTAAIIVSPEVISFKVKGFYMEYGILAMFLVLLFYIFRENKAASIISVIILYALHGYYRVALYKSAYSSEIFWNYLFSFTYVWNELNTGNILSQFHRYYFNAWGAFALIPIFTLERVRTSWIRLNKYVGYVFYPAHMTILIVIAIMIKGN